MINEFGTYLRGKGLKEATIRHYCVDVADVISHVGNLLTASSNDIQHFVDKTSLTKSPRTISRKLASVCSFYNWACETGLREDNPIVRGKRNKRDNIVTPGASKTQFEILNGKQVAKLFSKIKSKEERFTLRDQLLYRLILFGGLKTQEIRSLSYADFDHLNKTLRIIRHGNPVLIDIGPLMPLFVKLLHLKGKRPPNDPIFSNKHGGPISLRSIRRNLKRFAEKAGIKISPAKLRFNCAIQRFKEGHSIENITRTLGYSDIKETKRLISERV